jgi:hypothetical protein
MSGNGRSDAQGRVPVALWGGVFEARWLLKRVVVPILFSDVPIITVMGAVAAVDPWPHEVLGFN